MKSHKQMASALAACLLLFGGSLLAQDMSQPPPPQAMPPPPTDSSGMAPPNTDSMRTPQGEVTVNSAPANAPAIGPAPSFEQLSGGARSITESQAEAYPPLANDFINADRNRDGKVSKAEYQHWLKQLK
jgi:hypothetical protein